MTIDKQKFEYIRGMLVEVRQLAEQQNADLLTYLIEMAVQEAQDIISGRRQLNRL